jgi:outer membrane protein assembly factor BamB
MISANVRGDDWPQWMGPTRDGVFHEPSTLTSIPAAGLKVLWRQPISGGYAGPAVAAGRVFVPDYLISQGEAINAPDKRPELKGSERLLCLDSKTGKALWQDEYPCNYTISYPAGPRCTPTVDGDLVYTLGAQGDLRCLESATGKLRWHRNLATEYKVEVPVWGHSAHPLVDGPRLICMVGGQNHAVVALDKLTGKELWRSLSSTEPGYCPPSHLVVDGKASILVWHPEAMAALEPETGKAIWTVDLKPSYGMSIARPQQEGNLLYASGIGSTSVLLRLSSDGSKVNELWRGEQKNSLYAANATPLIIDGVIYGSDCQTGAFMAVDTRDANRLWQTYKPIQEGERRLSHGTAFLTRQGENFWLFSETGALILAKLSRKGYQELGRMKVLEPTGESFGRPVVWSHPAFANQCVFCRNDKEIVCVSLQP